MKLCQTKPDRTNRRQKLQRLIPRAKVAFYLGCCTRTVKRLEHRGQLTAHVLNSRTTAYPENEVLKLIQDARIATPAGES